MHHSKPIQILASLMDTTKRKRVAREEEEEEEGDDGPYKGETVYKSPIVGPTDTYSITPSSYKIPSPQTLTNTTVSTQCSRLKIGVYFCNLQIFRRVC